MSAGRPTYWAPLAGSDPVPGDPDQVADLARSYLDTAAEIGAQTVRLRKISELEGWQGEAARKFADAAGDLATQLGRAHDRYDDAGRALGRWPAPLQQAQAESVAALHDAQAAEHDGRATQTSLLTGVSTPTPEQKSADASRSRAHDEAGARLQAAQQRLQQAVDALDHEARLVATELRKAAGHWKDGFWDRVKGGIRDIGGALKFIADALGWIATALAAIALVIALVVTAPAWLLVAAVVLTVGALVLHGLLLWSGSDQGSKMDVALDLIGVITFGYGRLVAPGLKAATTAARMSTSRVLAQQAAERVAAREAATLSHRVASWVQSTRIPLGSLRELAGPRLARATQAAAAASRAAAARVLTDGLADPGRRTVVAYLDRELAQHAAEVARLRDFRVVDPAVLGDLDEVAARLRGSRIAVGTGLAAITADKLDAVHLVEWKQSFDDELDGWLRQFRQRFTVGP